MNSNFSLAILADSNPALASDDESDDTFKCGVCYINDVIPQDNIVSCCKFGKTLCNKCVVKLNDENQVGGGKCPVCKRGFPFWLIEHFAALKLDDNHNHNHLDDDDDDEDDDISDEVHFDGRNLFPCRNHFGRNGRQFLRGCIDIRCQYSHEEINCRFGRDCQRRHSCLFSHPV
jgi:hypothetical protein